MALWTVILLAVFFIITLVLLSILLHYYKQAFECDSQTSFWCYTDWICDGGTKDSTGKQVDNVACHLKGLYGVTDTACSGDVRAPTPCTPTSSPDGSNPNLCTDGNLTTTPVDGNIFSCFCNMGNNVTVKYNPGSGAVTDTSPLTGDAVGLNACGNFALPYLRTDVSPICPTPVVVPPAPEVPVL